MSLLHLCWTNYRCVLKHRRLMHQSSIKLTFKVGWLDNLKLNLFPKSKRVEPCPIWVKLAQVGQPGPSFQFEIAYLGALAYPQSSQTNKNPCSFQYTFWRQHFDHYKRTFGQASDLRMSSRLSFQNLCGAEPYLCWEWNNKYPMFFWEHRVMLNVSLKLRIPCQITFIMLE